MLWASQLRFATPGTLRSWSPAERPPARVHGHPQSSNAASLPRMAQLVLGSTLQQFTVRSGWKAKDVLQWCEDNNEPLPAHTKPLTVKADGVLLSPSQLLPKDAMTIEVVESYDEDVTTKGDNGPQTLPLSDVQSGSRSSEE